MPRLAWIALLAACTGACREQASLPPQPGTPVTLHEIVAPGVPADARYSANVEAYGVVRVSAEVAGTIRSLRQVEGSAGTRALQPGDVVRKGDLLAQIDDSIYRQQLEAAEASLAGDTVRMLAGKDNYERYVAAGEGVSKSQVENALSRYESERAMVARSERTVEQARIQLSWCSVEAPRDGLLLSRRIETGDLVNAGSLLFEIGDTRRMKVVFGVPASLVEHIEQGTKLQLVVSDLAEREYEGPVTQISPSADPTSRVFDVEVTVDNADGALRVGMIATLELPASAAAGTHPVVSVPLDAIVRPPKDSSGFAVYVPDPNVSAAQAGSGGTKCVARLRRVEVGRVRRDQVEVREGLSVGERVIVRGSTIVQDGSAIRIIP